MKTILFLLLSILSMTAFSQSWNQISDFPGVARDDGTSFKIGNKVYCGTGRNAGFNVTADFWAFDLGLETWTPRASMPDSCKRQYATSFSEYDFSLYGRAFLFGGINASGEELRDIWRYNVGSWGAFDSWDYLGSMPSVGRGGSSSFILGSKAFIIGGKNQTVTTEAEVWEYDIPTNVWTQKNDLPFSGMWRGVSFVGDATGYVGLGLDSLGIANNNFYRYLQATDQWELVPQLSMPARSYVSHAQIGDSVYLYGGVDSLGNYVNTFERINLPSLTIDVLTPFPAEARKGAMAFASHDDFYITTGVTTTTRLNETWVAGNVVGLELLSESEIKVYQSGEEIIFESEQILKSIELISMDGRTIRSKKNNFEASINVKSINSGVYLWNIVIENGSQISGRIYIE